MKNSTEGLEDKTEEISQRKRTKGQRWKTGKKIKELDKDIQYLKKRNCQETYARKCPKHEVSPN